ncbi:uracil-DNA glycosylase family protein [Hymenobacter psoromatis]|uniref:uracil-DNA glycosylase family protein n=1 Tax=Hymenobacter psoromatis TaxID=1484116 RepID=UPI001CC18CA5|nr:uracil-DNA glycosylase family protein [Hymenobacter psoromatis]
MPNFADRQLTLLTNFPLPPLPLPGGAEVRNSYLEPEVQVIVRAFARKFYVAEAARVGIFGINPGRFGGGRTGVAFTDPVALSTLCGIGHALPRQRRELSSEFVYRFIEALGGPAEFYQHFYINSVYPLELTREGKNYNYYDAPALIKALWPDMRRSLSEQTDQLTLRRDVAVSLGRRNGDFLRRLNDELGLFKRIEVLDHPRFLMQYKRKALADNVARYVDVLGGLLK